MACADGMIRIPRTPAYSARLAKQLQQLRTDDEITDFSILNGDNSYTCHKVILAANSPVLKAMVMSGMTEVSEQQVDIDNIPAAVKEVLLQYMYTGEVKIPQEQLLSTVEASDYLELLELKELCLSNAVTVFKPSNVISWHKLSDKLDIDELKSKCSEIMSSSLAAVSKFSEFLELTVAELSSYISDVQETDVDQDEVLEATMGWIDHKSEQRSDYMEELLQKIELEECSVGCIEREIEIHQALLTNRPQMHFVFTKGLVEIAKKGAARRKKGVKRRGNTMVVVIGGQSNQTNVNKVCWELTPSMQFVEFCRIPDHGVRLGVCTIPGGFALTGGKRCALCSLFDLATKSWRQLAPLLHPRFAHGSIFVNARIFVFGGYLFGPSSESSSVHSLQVDEGRWTEEPDTPIVLKYPEVASVDRSVFVLNTHNNQLLHFDVEMKTWSHRANAPGGGCRGARMASVNGQLLLAGGNGKTFAQYNPSTNTWSTGNTPTLRHIFGALVNHEGKLYLIGGQDIDDVEEHDLDTKAWSVCDVKVPKNLYNLHALALDC